MIKLILFVVAVAIFGTGFITVLINQLSGATNIIMNLYSSNDWLLKIIGKLAVLFSHEVMQTVSGIYIAGFIISKTLYS
ncbi:hypothetical protein [Spiroplasma sp. ald]|uniref:hypothetical protein n=1 Tax=Spiroplasma sp. ald TaxID=2490849 RepID=UPI0037DDD561